MLIFQIIAKKAEAASPVVKTPIRFYYGADPENCQIIIAPRLFNQGKNCLSQERRLFLALLVIFMTESSSSPSPFNPMMQRP